MITPNTYSLLFLIVLLSMPKETSNAVSKSFSTMNPIKIKVEIAKRGLTQTQIANEIGTRPDMISQMVNGFNFYPRIAKAIQERYGIVIPRPSSNRLSGVKSEKLAA